MPRKEHTRDAFLENCRSSRCKEIEQCSFQLKILQCQVTNISQVYEFGSHVYIAEESSPKKPKVDSQLRSYIEDRIVSGKLPTQIHAYLTSNRAKIGLLINDIPTLKQIQGVLKRYRRSDINENDRVDTLINLLEGKCFDENMEDNKPFYFGVEIATNLGNVLLHADATFKSTQTSFPLLALGVSDRSGTFHLVCLVLTSNRNTFTWTKALREIKSLYFNITGSEMKIYFAMGDADDAQYAALMDIFPENTYLMCYFHVVQNIRDKCHGLSSTEYTIIMEEINLLHYAANYDTFIGLKDSIFCRWEDHQNTNISQLKEYVDKSWLKSSFHRWQAFWTPCGFTTTNNPFEQFNNTIKQTWTCRKKLKVPILVEKLFELLEYNSIHAKIFQQKIVPTADILKRMTSLRYIGLLREKACEPNVTSTIYQGKEKNEVTEIQPPLQSEIYAARLVDSTISHFARWVETKDMPARGWVVSLEANICPCLYFKKFEVCIHLLFALSEHNLAIPGLLAPSRTFVNRTVQRGRGGRGRESGHGSGRGRGRRRGGRPPKVGAALNMT